MTALTRDTWLPSLSTAVPEFQSVIDDHLAFNGEILDHLLFADLARFVLEAHATGQPELVDRILSWLDLALRTGDDAVQNLVSVSFVENIPGFESENLPFIETWPPALRVDADRLIPPSTRGSSGRLRRTKR